MIFKREDQEFLEKLAPTRTGKSLVRLLENIETYYADIRNLKDVEPNVRKDMLLLLKETLTDKLKILGQDELEKPSQDEFT